jgi:reactive intermediate/imine deaminase
MVDKTLYISGQLGMNTSGEMVGGGVSAEAEQALTNIGNILAAAGGGFKDVIKTTVLMKDINKFSEVNGIYGKFFTSHQPARAAFQVAALPKAGNVEIEAVAVIGAVNVGSILINGML